MFNGRDLWIDGYTICRVYNLVGRIRFNLCARLAIAIAIQSRATYQKETRETTKIDNMARLVEELKINHQR